MTTPEITADLVRDLLRDQHPDLADLPLSEVQDVDLHRRARRQRRRCPGRVLVGGGGVTSPSPVRGWHDA